MATKARRLPSERQLEQPSERHLEQDEAIEIVQEKATLAVAAGLGKLSGLLGEQAVKCMLRRRDEESKKWEFQETFPVEDFSFEYVRDVFGGGEYQIQALDESGDFVKSFTFHVDRRYRGKRWTEQHGVTPTGGDGPTWIAAALDKMSEAIKVMAERKPDPPPAPAPAPDPMAMIRAIGETMKSLTPALPPPPAPAPDLEKQLSLIEKVVNVGTKIVDARGDSGEGPSSGDVYMSAVSKLADPIVELVKAKTQQEALRAAPRRPALPPAPPAGPVPQQPQEKPVHWLAEIQRWLPLIVGRHRKGLSAEDTAFFVLDELSPQTLASLAQFLSSPDSEAKLKQVVPAEVASDEEWFGEFMQAVRDYLEGGEDEADEEAESSGESPILPPLDLEAESKARIAKLHDKPQAQEQ